MTAAAIVASLIIVLCFAVMGVTIYIKERDQWPSDPDS